VKRSRSGTASQRDGPGISAILLIAALGIVLAFAASLIFGLRGADEPEPQAGTPLTTNTSAAAVRTDRATVEVLNGSGKQGLARLATERLRDAGYDVVQFGNASRTTRKSYVLDRIGKREVAAAIAAKLGIDSSRTLVDTTRFVDATVVLGKDWPPHRAAPPVSQKSWKDRLLRR